MSLPFFLSHFILLQTFILLLCMKMTLLCLIHLLDELSAMAFSFISSRLFHSFPITNSLQHYCSVPFWKESNLHPLQVCPLACNLSSSSMSPFTRLLPQSTIYHVLMTRALSLISVISKQSRLFFFLHLFPISVQISTTQHHFRSQDKHFCNVFS